MLLGSNTLDLNEATIIAALQHYFDTVLFAEGKAPTVKGVSLKNNYGDVFSVAVSERDAKGAA